MLIRSHEQISNTLSHIQPAALKADDALAADNAARFTAAFATQRAPDMRQQAPTHVYIHLCMYIYIYICVCICMYVFVCVRVCVCACMCVRVCVGAGCGCIRFSIRASIRATIHPLMYSYRSASVAPCTHRALESID